MTGANRVPFLWAILLTFGLALGASPASATYPERCDGVDNDGDGLVDEDFPLGDFCAVGACDGQHIETWAVGANGAPAVVYTENAVLFGTTLGCNFEHAYAGVATLEQFFRQSVVRASDGEAPHMMFTYGAYDPADQVGMEAVLNRMTQAGEIASYELWDVSEWAPLDLAPGDLDGVDMVILDAAPDTSANHFVMTTQAHQVLKAFIDDGGVIIGSAYIFVHWFNYPNYQYAAINAGLADLFGGVIPNLNAAVLPQATTTARSPVGAGTTLKTLIAAQPNYKKPNDPYFHEFWSLTLPAGYAEGSYACAADGFSAECVAPAGAGTPAEVCGNGLDDDCDGLIDEGCGGPCGGAWPWSCEISVAEAYNRTFGTHYSTWDFAGLQELVAARGVPMSPVFTISEVRKIQVLVFDTANTQTLYLKAGAKWLPLYNPGPWTPHTRGWLPDKDSELIDLAQLMATHGVAASTPFSFYLGNNRLLNANTTYRLQGTVSGEFLLAYNDNNGLYGGDKDANEPVIHCMAPAEELCDGVDNDGDGLIDEGFDLDADGVTTCAGDCDDTNASVSPGQLELCDGLDNDCSGGVDEDCFCQQDMLTVSDPYTQADGAPAVHTWDEHRRWTATLDDAMWIWDEHLEDTPQTGSIVTFSRSVVIPVDAVELQGSIRIGADNSYRFWVNGVSAGESLIETNYFLEDVFEFDIGALLQPGENTLAFEVDNWPQPGGNAYTNPGGLLYRLEAGFFAPAAEEICNGVDDDCDGEIDEGLGVTTCGLGACLQTVGACWHGVAPACEPLPAGIEACNGVDDDCDGEVDEGLGAPSTCGQGVCAASGELTCEAGALVDTCAAGSPTGDDSDCDGVDDDCDGLIDEHYAPAATSCGVGACAGAGELICAAGVQVDTCAVGSPTGDDADCDGVDDDCDGLVDEHYAPVATGCGLGVCAAVGALVCEGGALIDTCAAGAPTGDDSDCDILDDDCDGLADEHYAPVATSCGLGVCAAAGELICEAGALIDTCVAGPVLGPDDDCDGLDVDCDGAADEHFEILETRCGLGACAAVGALICDAGEQVDTCAPGAPAPEICDDVDNDCDGEVDEGFDVGEACHDDPCGYGLGVPADLHGCVTLGERVCTPDGDAVCELSGCRLTTVWQLGRFDFDVNPIIGASEFPAQAQHSPAFDYTVEGAGSASPMLPAYLSDIPLSQIDPSRPQTDSTPELRLHFTLDEPLYAGAIHWSRYGSEQNDLLLGIDGALLAATSGVEGGNSVHELPLPLLEMGYHELTIVYQGGGAGNGNYLDAIRLVGADCGDLGPETCGDGLDDDCDCAIDEGFEALGEACSDGIGACYTEGAWACGPDDVSLFCTAEAGAASPEVCNGEDDDCDGAIDDDLDPTPTTCGLGVCAASGELICEAGAWIDTCAAVAPTGDDADCDGLDDDCDGLVDEHYTPTATSCGQGVCAALGALICEAGALSDTCAAGAPTGDDADCDGLDDDCDGRVDEHYVPPATGCGLGVCAAVGSLVCEGGAPVDTCVVGSPTGDDRDCDDLDDDCDGLVDEHYAPTATSCGVGVCAAVGALVCEAGAQVDTCAAGAPTGDDGDCDDLDDDCDGVADEHYLPPATGCGVGACAAVGALVCEAGAQVDTCAAGSPTGDDSDCDGVDDDCDGLTDEHYAPPATSCGLGVCAAVGELVCEAGAQVDTCAAGSPVGPDDDCDQVDEDCDGAADEHFEVLETRCGEGACAAVGALICDAGALTNTCAAGAPSAEVCDEVDNDCDGEVDEGFDVGALCHDDPCGYGFGVPADLHGCVSLGERVCTPEGDAVCELSGCRLATIWQLGQFDFNVNPIIGASEFPAQAQHSPAFDYIIEGAGSASPMLSAYLSDIPLSQIDPNRPQTNSTPELRLHFTLDAPLHAGAIHWSRYGSEQNDLLLGIDGALLAATSGVEAGNSVHEIPLPLLDAGYHVLTVVYQGGGAGNGNYLDAIRLVGAACGDLGPETCGDGLDDDCDCAIDEGFEALGEACSDGLGACYAEGAWVCGPDDLSLTCTAEAGLSSPEICNAVDDDCDGVIDDGLAPTPTTCGAGVCAASGERICADGAWTDTCVAGAPTGDDADCDGLDDDCDGAVDNRYVSIPTTCGLGVCAASGALVCEDGVEIDTCAQAPAAGDDTDCDGLDDDCDGVADNHYVPVATACGQGVCGAVGVDVCKDGVIADTCVEGSPTGDDADCDGLDDDCDGWVDNHYQRVDTFCGVGVCAAIGELACQEGGLVDTCAATAPTGDDTDCDQVDDDCDGAADEHYVAPPTTCGLGVCAAAGELRCVDGNLEDSCTPGQPTGDDADCDGQDDDCDGVVDGDFTPAVTTCGQGECAATGLFVCVGGASDDTCVAGEPQDEACDDLDNDCDGETDEDFDLDLDGYTTCEGDCDDEDGNVNPGVVEAPFPAHRAASGVQSALQGTLASGGPVKAARSDPEAALTHTAEDAEGGFYSMGFDGELVVTFDCPIMNGPGDDLLVWEKTYAGNPSYVEESAEIWVWDDVNGGWAFLGVATNMPWEDRPNVPHEFDLGAVMRASMVRLVNTTDITLADPANDGFDVNGLYALHDCDGMCNGVDDDCDGETDEGFDLDGDGFTICQGDCDDQDPAVNPDGLEVCNGVDDNCSGEVDESYGTLATACGVGACQAVGEILCEGGVQVDTCTAGPPTGADDDCDGVDDDCDGAADEHYLPPVTSCGIGACLAAGALVCQGGALIDTCAPGASTGADDDCDGVDDDCDGVDDGAYVAPATGCGIGACAATGALACQGGALVDTCAASAPTGADDDCDGVDDDCDGAADEHFPTVATSCGLGVCAATGAQVCQGGAVYDTCTAGAPTGDDADCDGLDDDCNGLVDENYEPLPTQCGLGVCAAQGELICAGGAQVDTCKEGVASGADDDCDGVDDDCDGAADEHYTPEAMICGVGVCVATGERICQAGAQVDVCTPGAPTGADADCDGKDDDCDGANDDDYEPLAMTCGQGECAATGERLCEDGALIDVCAPGKPADEGCDDLDNDCDGQTDEVCGSISGVVFLDLPMKGQIADERPIPGVEIVISDGDGSHTVTTDEGGSYLVEDLLFGPWEVQMVEEPYDLLTTPNPVDVTVAGSETVDFGVARDFVTRNFLHWRLHPCAVEAYVPVEVGADVYDSTLAVRQYACTLAACDPENLLGHQLLAAKLNAKAFGIGPFEWGVDGEPDIASVSDLITASEWVFEHKIGHEYWFWAFELFKLNNAAICHPAPDFFPRCLPRLCIADGLLAPGSCFQ